MLLADCHLFQSSGDLLPVVFEIQHDDILTEIDVIEICECLGRADDICLRKFSFVAFEHLIKRDAGGQLKDLNVSEGDTVKKGAIIGYVNAPTKYYSEEGSNLYFAMKKDGKPIDPIAYLP